LKQSQSNTQAAFTKISLNNAWDYSYSGPIWVGSTGQQLEVVYDTGSDWLCIENIDCRNGKASKFDYNKSQTLARLESKESVREYGSATLTGVEVTDITCLVPHTEAEL